MTIRLVSVLFSALFALLAASGAQAAPEKQNGPLGHASQSGSITKANSSKNFKARSTARYAYAKKKGYRSANRGYKSSNRYAVSSKRKSSRVAGRAITSGYGGGTSRSCLTSEARALLARIESNFGPVQIVSTCRPGAVIAGSGKPSKHRYGQAIDFNAGGRKAAIVSWLIANHHSGGTMTYAGMNHIHVDIGYRFVKLNHGGGRRRA